MDTSPLPPNRHRAFCLVACVVTMALGLASRRFPIFLPALFGKYPGDVLWATMVFFGWGALLPKQPIPRIALSALVTTYGIEVLKFYRAPWMVSLRASTLGHLLFGSVFSWENLVAYAVGVALGVGVEHAAGWFVRRNVSPAVPSNDGLPISVINGGGRNMAGVNVSGEAVQGDSYNLNRFVQAQERDYERALSEIRRGRKTSHWMWYIFPQAAGLGFSPMSQKYAIKDLAEARAYLAHPLLGPRLIESVEAVLDVEGRSASEIFGYPDDMKLKSSATLFACVSPAGSVFHRLLDKYFGGQKDPKTLDLVGLTSESA